MTILSTPWETYFAVLATIPLYILFTFHCAKTGTKRFGAKGAKSNSRPKNRDSEKVAFPSRNLSHTQGPNIGTTLKSTQRRSTPSETVNSKRGSFSQRTPDRTQQQSDRDSPQRYKEGKRSVNQSSPYPNENVPKSRSEKVRDRIQNSDTIGNPKQTVIVIGQTGAVEMFQASQPNRSSSLRNSKFADNDYSGSIQERLGRSRVIYAEPVDSVFVDNLDKTNSRGSKQGRHISQPNNTRESGQSRQQRRSSGPNHSEVSTTLSKTQKSRTRNSKVDSTTSSKGQSRQKSKSKRSSSKTNGGDIENVSSKRNSQSQNEHIPSQMTNQLNSRSTSRKDSKQGHRASETKSGKSEASKKSILKVPAQSQKPSSKSAMRSSKSTGHKSARQGNQKMSPSQKPMAKEKAKPMNRKKSKEGEKKKGLLRLFSRKKKMQSAKSVAK